MNSLFADNVQLHPTFIKRALPPKRPRDDRAEYKSADGIKTLSWHDDRSINFHMQFDNGIESVRIYWHTITIGKFREMCQKWGITLAI